MRIPLLYLLVATLMPSAPSLADAGTMLAVTVGFADEEPVTIVVPGQGLAAYRSFRHHESFGLVPRLDRESGAVEIQITTLKGERPDYVPARTLELVQARAGSESVTTLEDSLTVEIKVSETLAFGAIVGSCTVTCGNIEVTGRAVVTTCGSCLGEPNLRSPQ